MKTVLLSGEKCPKGTKCFFAHGATEIQILHDDSKKSFSHTIAADSEKKSRISNKTKHSKCKFFEKG